MHSTFWDRLPRIVFQGMAGAFVIFAWMVSKDTKSGALIALGFGALCLAAWAVLFVSHFRAADE